MYDIISDVSIKSLIEQVNNKIADGWIVNGSPFVWDKQIHQSVVFIENEYEKDEQIVSLFQGFPLTGTVSLETNN